MLDARISRSVITLSYRRIHYGRDESRLTSHEGRPWDSFHFAIYFALE